MQHCDEFLHPCIHRGAGVSTMAGSGKKKVKGPEIPKDETLEETEARLADNPMKLCIFQVGP